MEIKSTPKNSGDRNASTVADDANTNAPTVLTCIPGINPVTAPQRTPNIQAIISSRIFIHQTNIINNNINSITIIIVVVNIIIYSK